MSSATQASPEPRTARGTFWAFFPVGLLGASLTGVGALASIAAHDPGFALEKNYYEQAVHYDTERAQWAENDRLGYQLTLELPSMADGFRVHAQISDRNGAPLQGASVHLEAFANARAGDRREVVLAEASTGVYEADVRARRAGLWEFRITVQQGADRFTQAIRSDVLLSRGAP